MNKKTLTIGLLSAMLTGSVLFASSASAFWPFDGWFQKGGVKGKQTEVREQRSIKNFFRGATPSPTPTTVSVDEQQEMESSLTEDRLNRAVKGKMISEANRKIMLAKLAEIKKRREELKKLQQDFVAWMKTIGFDPEKIVTPKPEISVQNQR